MEAKFICTEFLPARVYKNRSKDNQSDGVAKKSDFDRMKLEANGFNKNIDRRKEKSSSAKPQNTPQITRKCDRVTENVFKEHYLYLSTFKFFKIYFVSISCCLYLLESPFIL